MGRRKKKKKEKWRFAARASGNALASDGTRINEGRRRSSVIKPNQYYGTRFTHQLAKTKENRKETPHHLIQLMRANFLRYEGRCHQRHQQREPRLWSKTKQHTAWHDPSDNLLNCSSAAWSKDLFFLCQPFCQTRPNFPHCMAIFSLPRMTNTPNVHQKAMLQQTLPICQSPAHVPALRRRRRRKGGGGKEERTRGTVPEAKQKLFTITWTQKTTKKKNANTRMHTNEQPRQSGGKQELINAPHLSCFCLPMDSLIHLLGEAFYFLLLLFFFCSTTVQSKKIFSQDQSKREGGGQMQPTIFGSFVFTRSNLPRYVPTIRKDSLS